MDMADLPVADVEAMDMNTVHSAEVTEEKNGVIHATPAVAAEQNLARISVGQ